MNESWIRRWLQLITRFSLAGTEEIKEMRHVVSLPGGNRVKGQSYSEGRGAFYDSVWGSAGDHLAGSPTAPQRKPLSGTLSGRVSSGSKASKGQLPRAAPRCLSGEMDP